MIPLTDLETTADMEFSRQDALLQKEKELKEKNGGYNECLLDFFVPVAVLAYFT
jgi:hypothetical protein